MEEIKPLTMAYQGSESQEIGGSSDLKKVMMDGFMEYDYTNAWKKIGPPVKLHIKVKPALEKVAFSEEFKAGLLIDYAVLEVHYTASHYAAAAYWLCSPYVTKEGNII
jgi:hypothetical protein